MKKNLRQTRKKTGNTRSYRHIFICYFFPLIVACGIFTYKSIILKTAEESFYKISNSLGFLLKDIYVTESGNAPLDRRIKKLCLNKGSGLFIKSTSEVFEDLIKNPWIKNLTLHKGMPDKISINVCYKKAIAIFQKKSKFALIDNEGNHIEFIDIKKAKLKLPLVIGTNANVKANDILTVLSSYPNILTRVKVLSYIRERRWDVILNNGIIVKLPEDGIAKALDSVDTILRQTSINRSSLCAIDLRVQDKVIFSGSKMDNQNGKKNLKI